MATQIRSFIETFRGYIAGFVALLTFGGSLLVAFSSGALVADPPQTIALAEEAGSHDIIQAGLPQGLVGSSVHVATQKARSDANKDSQDGTVAGRDEKLALSREMGLLPENNPLEEQSNAPFGTARQVDAAAVTPLRSAQPGLALQPAPKLEPRFETKTLKVRSGDTLEKILDRAGAERQQAYYATKSLSEVHNPRSLRVGQAVDVVLEYPVEVNDSAGGAEYVSDTPQLKSLSIETDVDETVSVALTEDGNYKPERILAQLDKGLERQGGTISSSLYVAAIDVGVPDSVIANLIGLYSYDIDFQREIRVGDEFEILYERYYDEAGNALKSGNIEYASMTVQGRQKGYYRFKTPDDGITDYYDANGQSAKKFLMRTPINGARISSGFGRRKHPVLGYTKMHQGTDFAAPTGTPIFAAGNGVIERASPYGSYGNYVRIRHANGYKTAYAHMSRYGRGIKQGVRVKQGQVIGYVGATGRVTGAHLHYEVIKDGGKVNPLHIKVPTGRKLNGDILAAFEAERARIDGERENRPDWRAAPVFVDAGAANGG